MKKILAILLLLVSIFALVSCTTAHTTIDTRANRTFFPTARSDLHRQKLQEAYINYERTKAEDLAKNATDEVKEIIYANLNSAIDPSKLEIYNYVSKRDSRRYDLDVFLAVNEQYSLFVMYKDEIYPLTTFYREPLFTHIAITDINGDGNIEILISYVEDYGTITFDARIYVVDTKTKAVENLYGIDKGPHYFKENEEGIISIYYAEETIGDDNINKGKLDESFYEKANNLVCVPSLNTVKYQFNEKFVQASCELFDVEVTIDDKNIDFPYYVMSRMLPPRFKVKVKMTYLGEPFYHSEGCAWIEGARISFVCKDYQIRDDRTGGFQAITTNHYYTGREIESEYEYYDYYTQYLDSTLENKINTHNPVGTYDMVISFKIDSKGIDESIVIKDFLQITR